MKTYFTKENIQKMKSGFCVPAGTQIRTLYIQKPTIKTNEGKTRLSFNVLLENESREIWFEVEEKYGEYLCFERSDAIVIGLLNWAMRERCDIVSDVSMTEELYYQITTYLIPALTRASKKLYAPKIKTSLDATYLPCGNGVGTGVSCGVDSMHVIANYWKSEIPSLKLTHLVLNNVGSFYHDDNDAQYHWHANHVRNFCKEYGFELILTNSNFSEAFPQNHFFTHTYSSCFATYMLQKLWKTYFYASSGDDFSTFNLIDSEFEDSAHYELLSLQCFSTRTLKIYSEGGAIERIDKVKRIIDFEPAQKYLHVCVSDQGGNCNVCSKCRRTLVILDAFGALGKFLKVFDVEFYKKHHLKNRCWLLAQQFLKNGDKMTFPAYEILKKDIPVWAYIVVLAWCLKSNFKSFLFSKLSKIVWLKKLYRKLLRK